MRSIALAAVSIIAFAVTLAAADPKADKAEKQRADKLFEDGRKYLATKEYALACTAFEQSQQADPAIGTQLNIALCYEQWGHVASAYRAYIEAERLAVQKKDDRAKGARKKIDALGPTVPRLTLVLPTDADPAASVVLDGQEIARDKLADELLVEIGDHRVEGRVPGMPPHAVTIKLAASQHLRFVIELPKPAVARVAPPPPPPPPPARRSGRLYAGIALGGAGVIALGLSAHYALGARSDYASAIGDCPMLQCTTEAAYQATQDARSRASTMSFVAVGGVALAAAGVYLVVTSGGKRVADQHTAVGPLVGPGLVGLAIGGPL